MTVKKSICFIIHKMWSKSKKSINNTNGGNGLGFVRHLKVLSYMIKKSSNEGRKKQRHVVTVRSI